MFHSVVKTKDSIIFIDLPLHWLGGVVPLSGIPKLNIKS